MFTGIVKEIGCVERIIRKSSLASFAISSHLVYEGAQPSESIAVDGVCLTMVKKERNLLFFEVIDTTLRTSNLKRLKPKAFVNLEPSLTPQDKIGGHFVLGHVDGEGKIKKIISRKDFWQFEIEVLPEVLKKNRKFLIERGSVAVEGISLTIKKVLPRSFLLDIIPFTYKHTNLQYKKVGDWLNIEFDYLLKRR